MLAAELTLAGTDVVVVERRANQELDGSRAGGLHARTIEVLDQRGVAERFLDAGQTHPSVGYGRMTFDITDFPSRHNSLLALWQRDFERILAEWVLGELAVPIVRTANVVGLDQDGTGVDIDVEGALQLRAQYLVGCDGGRSLVRKAGGIDFPGFDASISWMIAEVDLDGPELGMRPEGGGIGPVNPGTEGGPYRVLHVEAETVHTREPTLDDLRAALQAIYGTDFGARNPTWISRFNDTTRQAAAYRNGRVLLAGDAAHIHAPTGGQGLNIGVQDAVNLGWKLAQVVDGTSPESLLDTYHAERHPVGARVLQNTMVQVALITPDERHDALRESLQELLALDEPRRRIVGMISGLDVHYDLGGEHPLVGRRVPDLDLQTADGPTRVYRLLHDARPVLVNFGSPATLDVPARVRVVDAQYDGAWDLPVVGAVAAPPAVLIRPDGYVAWVGECTDRGLPQVLARWFGPVAL
jgi:3-(3-hydroxy-phenyl)propionate hydroxylase